MANCLFEAIWLITQHAIIYSYWKLLITFKYNPVLTQLYKILRVKTLTFHILFSIFYQVSCQTFYEIDSCS